MTDPYTRLAEQALQDRAPSEADALWMLDSPELELLPLLHAAFVPRRQHFGRQVMVHVLNNVQNGLCPEDCGYCSQSRDSTAAIRKYPLKSDEEILVSTHLCHPSLCNDNLSGIAVAALVARELVGRPRRRGLRLVYVSQDDRFEQCAGGFRTR